MEQTLTRSAIAGIASFRDAMVNVASILFGGKRDLYKAFGYKRYLTAVDYRSRYRRNAIANRVVKALPKATWRGGAEVVEDEDPETETAFEQAFMDMDARLNIWDAFEKADILAGIGRYAVIFIGAPGDLDQPLLGAGPDEIIFLETYSEDDARISTYEIDIHNERFGKPLTYQLNRNSVTATVVGNAPTLAKPVHWSRIIHIADGLLDDKIFGEPRLECVWNLFDDLEKLTGGGSEAFYKRADQGRQYELDPMIKAGTDPASKAALKKMKQQIHEYENDMRRDLITRGVKITSLGSDVADFSRNASAVIDQISAGTGIPQRILMGSERGQLASTQDRSNWDDRVEDRRMAYAIPMVVRPFIQRMIDLGALPEPVDGYDVQFAALRVMDDTQRAVIAGQWAEVNQKMGETVVTPDDIRTRVLDLASLADSGIEPTVTPAPIVAAKGGAGSWKHIHRSADRFRRTRPTYRQRVLRRRAISHVVRQIEAGAGGQE